MIYILGKFGREKFMLFEYLVKKFGKLMDQPKHYHICEYADLDGFNLVNDI